MSYLDIGGLDMQKQEIKEAVELPLPGPPPPGLSRVLRDGNPFPPPFNFPG